MSQRGWLQAGLAILAIFLLVALLAPVLAPYPPSFRGPILESPSSAHWLGTDQIGLDITVQLVYGTRVSLSVGVAVGVLAAGGGLIIGILAGIWPVLDAPLARAMDLFLAVPRLPVTILVALLLRPTLANVVLLLALFGWPLTARVALPMARALRSSDLIALARLTGASRFRITVLHVLPQFSALAVVQFVLEVRYAVVAEAGLALLGLEDPTIPSWGNVLNHATADQLTFLTSAWTWLVLPPSLLLTLFSLALGWVAAASEQILDPRTAGRMSGGHAALGA